MQRCRCPHDEGVLAVSSTSSGRQLRKPDDHTCRWGETVPPTDDEQQNAKVLESSILPPEWDFGAIYGPRDLREDTEVAPFMSESSV